MAKRKYTRMGEEAKGLKCEKCKWEGLESQRHSIPSKEDPDWKEMVCPKCKHDTFYGLLEAPKLPYQLNSEDKALCDSGIHRISPNTGRCFSCNDTLEAINKNLISEVTS